MLNAETKKIINSARDVLVGKIPDPKAQVEQITFAMFYKFMDEKDNEAVSLGGKRQFFTGEFENFSWSKLMDPRLGGTERMDLYTQALAKMSQNPHIAQLFRDIYKDAFIPFRSPETLSLFLKEIDQLDYTNTESLGDAFEYLLSVMGSQGDAGQFRTPRHIIDFIVDVVDPQKSDTILDPACGTAGFLISSYKHIVKQHDGKDDPDNKETPLTPDEKKDLMRNLMGYDISPDMVRLSKVNLYLHGLPNPTIYEYDTLSSEEKWDENFDVILANPPFMSPKGGIKPHKRFSIQANRAEVLFVDYIIEHLKPNGRAGIIVPEGIVFKNDVAYKKLRKDLIEHGLLAVISMPGGIFQPYSPVKTSILILDKELAKRVDSILFIKINNDGYGLGVQRREISKNDLPHALTIINNYKKSIKASNSFLTMGSKNFNKNTISTFVSKSRISDLGNYYLNGDKYLVTNLEEKEKWPMVELGEVLDYEQPTKYIVSNVDYNDSYKTPVLTAGKTFILGYTNEEAGIFLKKLPVIIFDDFTTSTKFVDFPFKVKSSAMKILHPKNDDVNIKFLYYMMQRIKFSSTTHKRYWISEYSKIKIPLPPIGIQNKIVKEIESYQEAIELNKRNIEIFNNKIKDIIASI